MLLSSSCCFSVVLQSVLGPRRAHVCVHVCLRVHLCTYVYVHRYLCTPVCAHTCVCVCVWCLHLHTHARGLSASYSRLRCVVTAMSHASPHYIWGDPKVTQLIMSRRPSFLTCEMDTAVPAPGRCGNRYRRGHPCLHPSPGDPVGQQGRR